MPSTAEAGPVAEPAIYSDDNLELHFIGNNTLKLYVTLGEK